MTFKNQENIFVKLSEVIFYCLELAVKDVVMDLDFLLFVGMIISVENRRQTLTEANWM